MGIVTDQELHSAVEDGCHEYVTMSAVAKQANKHVCVLDISTCISVSPAQM